MEYYTKSYKLVVLCGDNIGYNSYISLIIYNDKKNH